MWSEKYCPLVWLTVLWVLGVVTQRCDAATDEYYTAAVAEFRPLIRGSSTQMLAENLAGYLELISATNQSTDIIVFPEASLNSVLQLTAVPAPAQGSDSLCSDPSNPSNSSSSSSSPDVADFLRQLACAAVQAQTYLVINVKEREECSNDNDNDNDCPPRGYRLFNTNVVLDRRGAVVSRYRKWNLYLEAQLNRTAEPEYAIFETDFNVTFGHFVCFDLLFYTPAQELVDRYQLKNIIVTKMFNSELPFLTASQLQQGWAWTNNVNLLAAGASLPQSGITGSGIYAGQHGALVRRMVGNSLEGERQLLVAQVPRAEQSGVANVLPDVERPGPVQRKLLLLQQPQLEDFSTWQVPLLNGTLQQQRLCHTDLCCDFQLSLQLEQGQEQEQVQAYNYRLGVFVGRRRYEEAQYSVVRLCGLFACRNESVHSCGQLAEEEEEEEEEQEQEQHLLQFNMLRISGEFVQRSRRQIMPSTLSVALYALQATELEWSVEEQEQEQGQAQSSSPTRVQLQLKQPHSQLLTFGIYGNYFDEAAGNGGNTVQGCRVALALLPLLLLLLLQRCLISSAA